MGSARAYKFLRQISSTSQILQSDTQTVSSALCAFNCIVKISCTNIRFISPFYSAGPEQFAAMPSQLETAMESLIMVFHRYAGKEGRSGTLTRRELRLLMENELSGFLKVKIFCHSLSQTSFSIGNADHFTLFSFSTVSEGPNHHRPNHEGLGCQ